MFRFSALVIVAGAHLIAPADSLPDLRSPGLTSQLTAALQARRLEAVATKDPEDSTRFVAALHYPGTQLLVYTAKAKDPALLDTRLQYKQYHDIYVELQGTSVPQTSAFFQDMKADGLPTDADDASDIVYGADGKVVVLGGDWRGRGISASAYAKQLSDADREYSRLLTLLLAEINPT
jgi:hypothetical protein